MANPSSDPLDFLTSPSGQPRQPSSATPRQRRIPRIAPGTGESNGRSQTTKIMLGIVAGALLGGLCVYGWEKWSAKAPQTNKLRTDEQLSAAKNFSLGGASFESSTQQVRELSAGKPPAWSDDEKIGRSRFILHGESENCYAVAVCFQDRVEAFGLHYNSRDTERLGGVAAVIARLEDRFGPESDEQSGELLWYLRPVNRKIRAALTPWQNWATHEFETGLTVWIFNIEVENAESKREREADRGFLGSPPEIK